MEFILFILMPSRGYDYYIWCKITVTSQVVHNKNIITMATSTLYSSAQLKYITFSYNILYIHLDPHGHKLT